MPPNSTQEPTLATLARLSVRDVGRTRRRVPDSLRAMDGEHSSLQGGEPLLLARSVMDHPLRLLLEQFVTLGGSHWSPPGFAVLASRSPNLARLRTDLQASLVASAMRLSSVDYARRKYVREASPTEERAAELVRYAYMDAYMEAKHQILATLDRTDVEGRPEPTVGEFGASAVLERVLSSYWSAHLLFNLGHGFEGYTVARLVLEQLAWACAAANLETVDAIEQLSANRCITQLKQVVPSVGKLYGFLSKATHIGYESHSEFLVVAAGRNAVLHARGDYLSYGFVILTLADLFIVVWELSQHRFLNHLESIDIQQGFPTLKIARPFLTTSHRCIDAIEAAVAAQQGAAADDRPQAGDRG